MLMICNTPAILDIQDVANEYGEYAYIRSNIMVRIEQTITEFKTPDGRDAISRGVAYSHSRLHVGDKVACEGDTYKIAAVRKVHDLVGNLVFTKAYLI